MKTTNKYDIMSRKFNFHALKFFVACVSLYTTLQLQATHAGAQVLWSNPSASTLWLNGGNWAGGSVPGSAHVALFQTYPTSGTSGIGIEMGASTNNGANNQAIGAINIDSTRTTNFILGNSSTTANGTLTLTGATVGSIADVIITNKAANAATLTLQNTQGSGNKLMTINCGTSAKNIVAGQGTSTTSIGNTIKITGTLAGSGRLSFLGGGSWNGTSGNSGGLLKLGATNSFSGGLNVGMNDGSSNGMLELDVIDAISNTTGNDINIYPGSELYLAATAGTYTAGNIGLNLSGKGNLASITGIGGALVTKNNTSYIWAGPVSLSGNAEVTVLLTATLTLSGNITGSGTLIKNANSNPGTLLLTGTSNNWTGGTQVGAGVLNVASGSAISNGSLEMTGLNTGVNSTLSLNNSAQTITSLASSFVPVTGTQTQNIILGTGHTLTLNQSANTTYGCGSVTTQNSIITGAGALVKTGTGILTLTSSGNTLSGGLTVSGGEVRFNPATTTAVGLASCPVNLNGGTLSTTNTTTTAQINLGTLNLSENSTIDLGTATLHNMKFANSASIAWTSGKVLNITNWTGAYNGTAGTKGRLYIGTSAAGLTSAQLAQIRFTNPSGVVYPATQTSSGEVVPRASVITTTTTTFGPFYNSTSNTIAVSFTPSGAFTGPFKVQLSNASGVFTADTSTGIIGSGSSSPINATLPGALSPSEYYRIRVICGSPSIIFGSDNGSGIVVLAASPAISSLSPASAIPGTSISIAGSNFESAAADNIVYFGATRATVTAATSTSLTVTVPAGATFAPVSVLSAISGLTGYSSRSFAPVYDTALLPGGQVNFQSHTDVATGASPFIGVIGDLDGDGKSDLVSVNDGAASISVYRNAGSAGTITTRSFDSPVNYATGYHPTNAKIADIDGDGKPDIMVTNSASATVSVFHNLSTPGTINFATKVDFSTTSSALVPLVVTIADFDGDGKPDMAIAAAYSNVMAVYRNMCTAGVINSATFAAPVLFATNSGPLSITAADFDGDNKIDIAVADTGSSTVSVFRNTSVPGTMNTSSFAAKVDFATGGLPVDVTAGDIDGDGKLDILVTNSSSNTVSVLHNTASAGMINSSSFAAAVNFATGNAPTGIALGDIDGDGKPDVTIANAGSASVSVLRNTATSGSIVSSSLASRIDFATGAGPTGITIGDIDGDNKPDIVTGNRSAASLSVFRNFRLPNVPAISGPSLVCSGTPANFINTAAGGTWTNAVPAVASINASGTMNFISSGADTVYYSVVKNSDMTTVSHPVIVATLADTGIISGSSVVCVGAPISLTESAAGGSWSSSNVAIATIDAGGVVTGIAPGAALISYTQSGICGTYSATHAITASNVPTTPAAISGATTITSTGSTSTLTDSTPGGTWSSSDSAIATVNSTGSVTLVSGGFATITYTVANSCGSAYRTTQVRCINPNHAPVLTFGTAVGLSPCNNVGTIDISAKLVVRDADTGQTLTWSLASAPRHGRAVASFSATSNGATVTPSNMSYVPDSTFSGRDTFIVSVTDGTTVINMPFQITIRTSPATPVITGHNTICSGITDVLTGSPSGGTFSDTSSLISVSSAGRIVGTNAGGTAYAIYTSPANTSGCTSKASYAITVVPPMPITSITGATNVCPGARTTFSNRYGGGTWSSSLPAIASVQDSVVRGITSGTAVISYTIINVCGNRSATKSITVTAPTVPPGISGSAASVCPGATIAFTNTRTGGVWAVTNYAMASISSTGVFTALSGGRDTVQYSITNSCGQTGTVQRAVVLNSSPNAGTISGATTLLRGTTTTLTTSGTGGAWTSVFTSKATITSAGVVRGIAAGIDTIKYTVTNSCGRAVAMHVISITASKEENGGDNMDIISADVSIFPNPSKGTFALEIPAGYNDAVVTVSDITGRVVETRECKGQKIEFNFGNSPRGTYVLKILASGKQWNKQIVID